MSDIWTTVSLAFGATATAAHEWSHQRSWPTKPQPVHHATQVGRVAVDVDGVVFPFIQQWRRYWRREMPFVLGTVLDRAPDDAPYETWGWFVQAVYDYMCSKPAMFRQAIRAGIFEHGEPIDKHAAATLDGLRARGVEIVFITKRNMFPELTDECRRQTLAWLAKHSLIRPKDTLILKSNKLCTHYDVMIEDMPHNWERIAAAGRHAVLLTQPWNRKFPTPDHGRVSSWKQFGEMLSRISVRQNFDTLGFQ